MKQILYFILKHPLGSKRPIKALFRFFSWQISYRLLNRREIIFSVTDKSKMKLKPGLAGASGNYYCGLLEFEDMAFCLHYLRSEDVFFDVGANVGIFSILASGHVGCQSIAFEPDNDTIVNLNENISINQISNKVKLILMAVGEEEGVVRFSKSKDTINHVVIESDTITSFTEVNMTSLNQFTDTCPALIKIDVEGFEWNVLNGATNILQDPKLSAIIIEINGSGSYFGVDDKLLHQFITQYGFSPYSYDPFDRSLCELETYGNLNTIYIRNEVFVQQRLTNAESFVSFGIKI